MVKVQSISLRMRLGQLRKYAKNMLWHSRKAYVDGYSSILPLLAFQVTMTTPVKPLPLL